MPSQSRHHHRIMWPGPEQGAERNEIDEMLDQIFMDTPVPDADVPDQRRPTGRHDDIDLDRRRLEQQRQGQRPTGRYDDLDLDRRRL